jgi:hypothetical protein
VPGLRAGGASARTTPCRLIDDRFHARRILRKDTPSKSLLFAENQRIA